MKKLIFISILTAAAALAQSGAATPAPAKANATPAPGQSKTHVKKHSKSNKSAAQGTNAVKPAAKAPAGTVATPAAK